MTEFIILVLLVIICTFLFFKGFKYIYELEIDNTFFSFIIKSILYIILIVTTGLLAAVGGIILSFLGQVKNK